MKGNVPTPEELERSILGLDIDDEILTRCISCGFEEKVPDFIYDECSFKKVHIKFRKSISTLACGRCGKNSAIPSRYFSD